MLGPFLTLALLPKIGGPSTAPRQLSAETNDMSNSEFYFHFENKFRGSRTEVLEKLKIYTPLLQNLEAGAKRSIALDYGCGRGEWLEFLTGRGWSARGVDHNEAMAKEAMEHGQTVEVSDLLTHIRRQPNESATVISAFHVIENLPAEVGLAFIGEAFRVLAPGGVLILETPNPENILVGSSRFYADPTHIRPLPPSYLKFAAEYSGFSHCFLIGLNGAAPDKGDGLAEAFRNLLEFAPDYALVAQKQPAAVGNEAARSAALPQEIFANSPSSAEKPFRAFETRLEKVDLVDDRFDRLDDKLRNHRARFAKQEGYIFALERQFAAQQAQLNEMEARLGKAQRRIKRLQSHSAVLLPITAPFVETAKFFSRRFLKSRRRPSEIGAAPWPAQSGVGAQISDKPLFWRGFEKPDGKVRILLVKVDHIGDLIHSFPAVEILRNAWPQAHFTLVCAPGNAALAEATRLFDKIIKFQYFPSYSEDLRHSPPDAFAKIRAAVDDVYDLAIDLRHDADTRPLLAHIDARYRAGFQALPPYQCDLDLALANVETKNDSTVTTMHNIQRLTMLASVVVNTFKRRETQFPSRLVDVGSIAVNFPPKSYVVLSPGAGSSVRKWSKEKLAVLAKRIVSEMSLKIVVVGGPREAEFSQAIAVELNEGEFLDLVGTAGLTDLARIIEGSSAFIGNDTGVTHLAATVGAPTVCIFSGAADARVWAPVGPKVAIVSNPVACSPCRIQNVEDCSYDIECMKKISVDDVFSVLQTVIGAEQKR